MLLARFLNNLFQERGFILIDANSRKYIIGKPDKEKPLTIKLLDKSLHYKLLIYPDLYFGEAYTNGTIAIENGTITEFLDKLEKWRIKKAWLLCFLFVSLRVTLGGFYEN